MSGISLSPGVGSAAGSDGECRPILNSGVLPSAWAPLTLVCRAPCPCHCRAGTVRAFALTCAGGSQWRIAAKILGARILSSECWKSGRLPSSQLLELVRRGLMECPHCGSSNVKVTLTPRNSVLYQLKKLLTPRQQDTVTFTCRDCGHKFTVPVM